MKLRFILFALMFFLFLLIVTLASSLPPAFTTPKTCSQTWGQPCNYGGSGGIDDAFDECDGTEAGTAHYVQEVYLNASSVLFDGSINVKCQFKEGYR
jgi:hypothetical protein